MTLPQMCCYETHHPHEALPRYSQRNISFSKIQEKQNIIITAKHETIGDWMHQKKLN